LGGFAGGLLALFVLCVVMTGCYLLGVFSWRFSFFFLCFVCVCVLFLCFLGGAAWKVLLCVCQSFCWRQSLTDVGQSAQLIFRAEAITWWVLGAAEPFYQEFPLLGRAWVVAVTRGQI
jgi:hypothetical protein